jgi:hypothetical protein
MNLEADKESGKTFYDVQKDGELEPEIKLAIDALKKFELAFQIEIPKI